MISQDTPSESNNTQGLRDLLAQLLFLDSRSAVLWGVRIIHACKISEPSCRRGDMSLDFFHRVRKDD